MAEMKVSKLRDMVDRVYFSEEYKARRKKWRRYLKEYRGEWWNEQEMGVNDSKVVFNLLFSTVETNAPLLTDNKPIWTVLSRWPQHQKIADNYTAASRAMWDALDLDQKNLLAVKDSQLFGTGIFKVYFSPDQDELRVDVIDPSTFFVAPGYEDLWDTSWCGQRKRLPLSWIHRAYPDKAEDVTSSEAKNNTEEENLHDRKEVELDEEFVTVYELWMRDDSVEEVENRYLDDHGQEKIEKENRPAYPNGRIITFTEDDVLLDDKPSPFRHGRPPYIALYDYTIPHSFWGMGEPDQIENLVREHNLRLQQAVEHARKHTKINYVVDGAIGISPEKFKHAIKNGDEVIFTKNDFHESQIKILEQPQLNNAVINLMDLLPKYVEEVTGVTDVTKGTVGKKSRQSANEISILMESSYTRTRQRVRNLEWTDKRLLYLLIELMQQYYTEPRPYHIRRDDGVEYGYVTNEKNFTLNQMKPNIPMNQDGTPAIPQDELHPDDAQSLRDYELLLEEFLEKDEVYIDFEIQIDTNSTLPLDKQSLANLSMRLAEKDIIPKEALLEILRFPNKDRYIRIMKQQREQEQKNKQPERRPGPQGPGRTMT